MRQNKTPSRTHSLYPQASQTDQLLICRPPMAPPTVRNHDAAMHGFRAAGVYLYLRSHPHRVAVLTAPPVPGFAHCRFRWAPLVGSWVYEGLSEEAGPDHAMQIFASVRAGTSTSPDIVSALWKLRAFAGLMAQDSSFFA